MSVHNPPPPAADEAELFRTTVRKLAHDVLHYFPGFVIPALVSALHVYIFTRLFDPVEFGRYSLVFSACQFLTLLLGGWLTQSVLRYQPRFPAGAERDAFVASLSRLLGGYVVLLCGALAVAWLFARQHLGSYGAYYAPAAVMVVAGVAYLVVKSVFQAGLESAAVSRFHILFALLRLSLALAFVEVVARSAVGLIVGPALAYVVLLLPMGLRLRPVRGGASAGATRPRLAAMFLRYGLPMVGWMIGAKVLELSDRYVIEYFRGSAEVGIYAASYNLVAMALWLVASPVITAAYPLITNAWEAGNRRGIQELVSTFSRYFLLVAMPLVAIVSVLARDLVTVFVGEAFREGYVVIPLVLGGLMCWNFGFYGDKGLRLAERTGVVFALVSICAAANVVLNILLVPRMGYPGAAWSTLLSSILYPVVVWIAARRTLAWRIPWGAVWRIAVAALAAAALARATATALGGTNAFVRLCVAAGVGLLTYPPVLWGVRGLRRYETNWIRGWFGGRGGER